MSVWQYVAIVLILISIILIVSDPRDKTYWIIFAIAFTAEIARMAVSKNKKEIVPAKTERNSMYKIFFYGICGIIVALILIGLWGVYALHNSAFHSIAMAVIILWACVFLGYFMWGVYFYNINLGITEEEWERIEENKRKKSRGEYYSEDELKEEPRFNPYADQTFGLPPGTVRGMIAFTLLFGSISMLIMSIGSKDCTECQAVIRDQYEFFKTAFLMMIAFYFGTRALEYLQPNKSGVTLKQPTPSNPADKPIEQINPMEPKPVTPPAAATQPPPPTGPPVAPGDSEAIVTINPMK
jgi:MFS family permease